jgi:outer membrane protein
MKHYSWLLLLFIPAILRAQTNATLSLQEAVKIALQNNFDITIARNETKIATINNNWANAGALPIISAIVNNSIASNNLQQNLSNGTVIKRDGATFRNLNAGVAVNWRFFDGMRIYATKKRLAELEKMGKLNFTKMSNEVVYNVMSSYYNIVQLKEQATATKEVISLYEERLKMAEARLRVGTGAKPDVLQAGVDLNEQRSALLTIENNILVAKTNLNNLLARDPSTVFETADSLILDRKITLANLQQKAQTSNPDILLAQSNLIVLMQTKKEVNAQRLPTATLNGNYNFGRNKNSAGFTLLNQSYGPSGGIGIAVPIFNGGNIKRQLKVADLNIANQAVQIEQLKNNLQAATINAWQNYTNAMQLAELEKGNLELIRENIMISGERFKKLSITSLELRQVQLNFAESRARLINAHFQAKMAEAELLLLAGEIGY